jgi:hypothetical protein
LPVTWQTLDIIPSSKAGVQLLNGLNGSIRVVIDLRLSLRHFS